MIEIRNLVKTYGDIKAVRDISFDVNKGEILGFLGPNGAGKSTTMNIITGAISATSGSVKINGYDILEQAEEAKSCIGYLPEQPPLYTDMTVIEYLKFIADLKLVPRADQVKHIAKIMALLKISDVRGRLIDNLSKGYKQRVGVAQALIGDPKIIILDEPTVGLDPKQIKDIRNTIRGLSKNHTVILSSHILSEIQASCDRVVIISNGQLAYENRIDAIGKGDDDTNLLEIIAKGSRDKSLDLLKSISGVQRVRSISSDRDSSTFELETPHDLDVREAVFDAFVRTHTTILGMRTLNPTLEDIFLKVTSSGQHFSEGE